MEPITLRLPSELLEELDSEAEDAGFSSRSEYIRHVLLKRNQISQLITSDTDSATSQGEDSDLETTVNELVGQVSDIHERLEQVESEVEDLRPSSEQVEEQSILSPVSSGPNSTEQPEKSDDVASPTDTGVDEDSETNSESRNEADQTDSTEKAVALLADWLEEYGPQKEVIHEIMIEAAKILAEEGPLQTSEIRDKLVDRYPDAYETDDGLWHSTVGRLHDEAPGFEKPKYGTYDFDVEQIRQRKE